VLARVEAGRQHGGRPPRQRKAEVAYRSALSTVEAVRRAGLTVGFATDLPGASDISQRRDFAPGSGGVAPLERSRQPVAAPAEAEMSVARRIGCIAPRAHATLRAVDGDPTDGHSTSGGE
jgi:imidazolonepropionase-like amidohydrolase